MMREDPGPSAGENTKARAAVYRLWKFRPRTEAEVIDKLRAKKFLKETIQETVAYFKKTGLINDDQFAKAWIQSRMNKPLGLRRIKLELQGKGISREILDARIEESRQDYSEEDAVRSLVKRRRQSRRNGDPAAERRRLTDYLLRRGFQPATVQRVVRDVLKSREKDNHNDDQS